MAARIAIFAVACIGVFLLGTVAVLQPAKVQNLKQEHERIELQVIAAVVVGGTSLMGGRASVAGSFLGVLIIAVLGSGLAQAGAPAT